MNTSVQKLKDIKETDTHQIGGKAANLAKLIQNGFPVPNGFVVGLNAFTKDNKLNRDAKQQIKKLVNSSKFYAVRSSALAEDAEEESWAGQFETFLNTKPEDIFAKIEGCHNSSKKRAKAYAKGKAVNNFDIAVVVQEMLKPEYSGVLFTKDPLTGKDTLLTEYIEGLGEELVSGKVDPKRILLSSDETKQTPFDASQLADLASRVEKLFGNPQDIEWAWADNQVWLVQARPITATQNKRKGYYLGEPNDLFYWGPTRAKPLYMSDFIAAVERFFTYMVSRPELPNPPKTICLFEEGKNVWLINATAFAEFTEKTFEAYSRLNLLEQDITNWRNIASKLGQLDGNELVESLINAWYYTEFAEFALYGAESALIKQLSRFDNEARQEIWGTFTVPDKPTFLNRLDAELAVSQNAVTMARKYPWVQDGYNGLAHNAKGYFEDRIKIVDGDRSNQQQNLQTKRSGLTDKFKLTDDEIKLLTLARKLAEFMDDRKAWMMQTRKFIKKNISNIEHGWFFNEGKSSSISQEDARELWQRYIDFKTSTSTVGGIVASNGGRHFVNGEVVIITSATDIVEDNKILIVPSTSPSYVPLMRSAKALVTDHGGMMSHAAIVAREFNLPCIVGTKQATKILKTGDKVVLDLVRGEVNK